MRALSSIALLSAALVAAHAIAAPASLPPEPESCDPAYIFFQSGVAAVAPEELPAISGVAKTLLESKLPAVVSGHTDAQEGDDKALSERRAAAVKQELVRLGVKAETLETNGRGLSEPLTPSAPGIAESFNRYVIIDFCGPDRFRK